MNIKRTIKYILIAILSLFLVKCGVDNARYYANKTPDINPNPKEKLKIYGSFPLDIEKYYINTSIHYFASNKKCDTQHWLAGASSIQEVSRSVITKMLDNSYYVIIYKDYYKQGICNWKIKDVLFHLVSKDDSQVSYPVFFTTRKNLQNTDHTYLSTKPINFICDYEYMMSTEYTRYFCEDALRNIGSSGRVIKISDLKNEFEVNFNQMVEPMKKLK